MAFLRWAAGFFDVQKTQSSTRLFAFIALMFAGMTAAGATVVALLTPNGEHTQFNITALGMICGTFCALTREAIRLRTEVPASPLPPPAPPPVVTDPPPTIVTVTEKTER
jgi:hypothetical protein